MFGNQLNASVQDASFGMQVQIIAVYLQRGEEESMLKGLVIKAIHMYKKYAPENISARCVFEPTCSQYALDAIEKYGLWKGMKKTIGRLWRCRPPNGGYDPA